MSEENKQILKDYQTIYCDLKKRWLYKKISIENE